MRKTLGVFLDVYMAFGREILRGLSDFTRTDPAWEISLLSYKGELSLPLLQNRDLHGIVAPFRQSGEGAAFLEAAQRKCPGRVVGVGTLDQDMPIPRFLCDSRQAGQQAAEYFLQKGFRSFAYLPDALFPDHWGGVLREQGFRDCLKRAGCKCETLTLNELASPHLAKHFPLALFCFNDLTARQAITALKRAGRAVPMEVAVMGVDDDPLESDLSPVPITSVRTNWYHAGVLAARHIMSPEISRPKQKDLITWVSCMGVKTRASTDVLVSDDPVLRRALHIIETGIAELRTVEACAKAVGVSRRSLETKLKSLTGHTVYDLMSISRLKRAKEILKHPDIPISEVAERAGYADSRMLGLAFRRYENETPSAYRQRTRP
jgi:LacI family transcriptional regulator